MSQLKDVEDVELPCIHIISDSEDSNPFDNGFAGFPSAQKRNPPDAEQLKEPPSARKKLKIDGERVEVVEDTPIDIDSISTNPRRTRTKVSSDTSSKFPVSSPSDTRLVAGQRKKYVKNTLPAGAFERMLNEVAQTYPLMTVQEKLDKWNCCSDLSDVEDVNNFDDQFQKREQQYKKSTSGRRSAGKDSPYSSYNYQHFRMVVLENLKGGPTLCTPPLDMPNNLNSADQPSCSNEMAEVVFTVNAAAALKPESSTVIHYDKILCPSNESSATKASPSMRLHWTDEDSVFRFNRLNPEIDKFSQLIKLRIDYKKEINLKEKRQEIFKTPTVPTKHNGESESSEQKIVEGTDEVNKTKEHLGAAKKVVDRTIQTRRSTGGKSGDGKLSTERKASDRRSSEKIPEVNSFQQDEFCNYLGLGINGKVCSPTPTDNKRRSLRVKRQQQQIEKKKERDVGDREEEKETTKKKDDEVTTTVDETSYSLTSPLSIKTIERKMHEEPKQRKPQPPPKMAAVTVEANNKTPEIKILLQIQTSPTPTTRRHTPSTATTANSAPPPIRRIRRTRATSNGTSTCPRSSQSDESPSKAATPRRRRLHHQTRRTNHTSDLSESLLSDPQVHEHSPPHDGRASTVPSSAGKKEEFLSTSQVDASQADADSVHKKFQRYLEESRKTKPSIFIIDSINNSGSKPEELIVDCIPINNKVPTEQPPELTPVGKTLKPKQWPKKRKLHRRLLKRKGIVGSILSQRILRNRTVMRPLRVNIAKHPMRKKIKAMSKKAIQEKIEEEKDKAEVESTPLAKAENANVNGEETQEEYSIVGPVETIMVDEKDEDQEDHSQTLNELENIEEVHCNAVQYDPLSVSSCHQIVKESDTQDSKKQTEAFTRPVPISFLTSPSSRMQNPLTSENGRVIYAYYELDILTVVQDLVVTFWKSSKLIQVLSKSACEWVYLGECKRLIFDEEINTPYKNRICVHNSIPIYVEMRAAELSKIRRDCNLISVYINVYYYHDEDLVAKSHSIQLDTVACLAQSVVYTTITDSRYFVMCWSQETIIGKPRSGLCKYSLTPHLDTLASIREFKCMRHEIRYLECTTDDNLIGFGDTQVTLWDHRSGDILMNYDLDFKLGSNFGSINYPSLEVGDKTVLIFQKTSAQELSIIAINVSHNSPSHRFVCTHILPPEFENLESSMLTEDYVILTNANHQELWIDCSDPHYMMQIKKQEGQSRFYARCKQNVIDIADDHLALETFGNFVLKMINTRE